MAEPPLLSIVVTSYTTERLTDIFELLDSIKAQGYRNVETIFVAEKSLELSEKIKAYGEARGLSNMRVVFNNGEPGLSAARNLGIEHAQGDIIAFVDDDVSLFSDWAEEMVKAYTDDSIIGVTGPAYPLWEDKSLAWFPEELYWVISCTAWNGWNEVREMRNAWGMNMSFQRQAFQICGAFRNEFGFHKGLMAEDNEFSLRVKAQTRKRIIYCPKVGLWHRVHRYRLSQQFIRERAYWIGRSRRMLKKLYQKADKGSDLLAPEHQLLRRILTRLFPAILKDLFTKPAIGWRKFRATFTALLFVTLGYYSHLIPSNPRKKVFQVTRKLNLNSWLKKIRPRFPFSALNIVWRRLDKQARSILDVGCGKGEPMAFINRDGKFEVIGIDLFQPYLEAAKNKGVYQKLILGDAQHLPFEAKSFDVVICMEVLEHLEQQDGNRLLSELERVAKKQVLLTTPVGRYKQHPFDGNPYQEHKFIWTVRALKKHGYKIKGTGIRGLPRENTSSGCVRFFREAAYALGGVFSYNFPQIACHVVAEKRLD